MTSTACIRILAALNHFPKEEEAREMLAAMLEELAPGKMYAVVAKMLELDSWPGPGTFRRLITEVTGKPVQQFSFGPKPMRFCPHCNDLGYIADEQLGQYVRCSCLLGIELPDAFLGPLKREPKTKPKRELEIPAISAQDIQDALHVMRVTKAMEEMAD